MVDPVTTQRWSFRLFFVVMVGGILFLRLLPLSTLPGGLPGPDLILCLGFAWVQRRPDILGPVLFGTVLFVADLLMGRPPGLWAAMGVVAAEFLRSRHHGGGEMPLAVEMAFATSAIVAVSFGYWLLLGVTGAIAPSLSLVLMQAVFTVIAYPFVAAATTVGFRLSPLSPADADAKGASR